ncbi:MAG: tyrosine-type recombinase/integrase [Acidobacteriota bacterium]
MLQKGSRWRAFVACLLKEAREAVEAWLDVRGRTDGPIFSTRTGNAMTRAMTYKVLKRFEAQANSRFSPEEHMTVSPHTLRHTLLRKLAETRGVHYAKKQSGHRSDKYIWRYVTPTDDELTEEDL